MVIESYEKLNWKDKNVSMTTPIVEERLNHNDKGVYDNREYIKALNDELIQTDAKSERALQIGEKAEIATEKANELIGTANTLIIESEDAKNIAQESAESAKQSAEEAKQFTPTGYDELIEKVDNLSIKKAVGTSLELDTQKGGIRVNEIVGKTHKSANLFDFDFWKEKTNTAIRGTFTTDVNSIYITSSEDDCYTLYGSNLYTAEVKSNCKYTFSFDTNNVSGLFYVFYYDANKNGIGNSPTADKKLTFTTPENAKYISVRFGVTTSGQTKTYSNIMLNEGETALPYEPYGMRSAGDTMGYVKLSDLSWSRYNFNPPIAFYANIPERKSLGLGFCSTNYYKINNVRITALNDNEITFNHNTTYVYVRDDSCTTVDQFLAKNADTVLAYELADNATPSQYALVVKEQGKNLFDVNSAYYEKQIFTINVNEVSGTANNFVSTKIKIDKKLIGKKLSFSAFLKSEAVTNMCVVAHVNNNIIKGNNVNGNTYNFSKITFVPQTENDTIFITYGSNGNNIVVAKDIMLEEGENATEYVPFESNQFSIPLSQPLCSIVELKDKIVKKDGKWYEYSRIKFVVDISSASWASWDNIGYYSGLIKDLVKKPSQNSVAANILAEEYQTVSRSAISNNNQIAVDKDGYLYVRKESTVKPSGMLIYELAEPILTEITDQSTLYMLESYKDKTYIDTADGLATLDIDYGKSDIVATTLNAERIAELALCK